MYFFFFFFSLFFFSCKFLHYSFNITPARFAPPQLPAARTFFPLFSFLLLFYFRRFNTPSPPSVLRAESTYFVRFQIEIKKKKEKKIGTNSHLGSNIIRILSSSSCFPSFPLPQPARRSPTSRHARHRRRRYRRRRRHHHRPPTLASSNLFHLSPRSRNPRTLERFSNR